jgi:uncharacterized RDD family membrane protein YckC
MCSTPMYLTPTVQEWLAFGHSGLLAARRELGSRGWGIGDLKLPGYRPDYRQGVCEIVDRAGSCSEW